MSTWTATIATDSRTDDVQYVEVQADDFHDALKAVSREHPGMYVADMLPT